MKTILRILITAIVVLALSYLLPGVSVANYTTAILVAIVLGILRSVVKPIFIVLTIPITIITLGIFLFFVNAIMVLFADYFVDGFAVSGIFTAMVFSFLLSFFQSILYSFLKEN